MDSSGSELEVCSSHFFSFLSYIGRQLKLLGGTDVWWNKSTSLLCSPRTSHLLILPNGMETIGGLHLSKNRGSGMMESIFLFVTMCEYAERNLEALHWKRIPGSEDSGRLTLGSMHPIVDRERVMLLGLMLVTGKW